MQISVEVIVLEAIAQLALADTPHLELVSIHTAPSIHGTKVAANVSVKESVVEVKITLNTRTHYSLEELLQWARLMLSICVDSAHGALFATAIKIMLNVPIKSF